jgi:hypothetical protein
MLIGPGVIQLEQRITDALCRGSLRSKESDFLQDISRKIGFYGERAFLSTLQAGWLFKILSSFEQGTKGRSSKRRTPACSTRGVAPSHSSSKNASESPELMRTLAGLDNVSWAEEEPLTAFDINEASEAGGRA